MDVRALATPLAVEIGTHSRAELRRALSTAGVLTNEFAEALLEASIFDSPEPESLRVVARSLAELGLVDGAVLPDVFRAAAEAGLELCDPSAGPYLRLALLDQGTAPDNILTNGHAPSGSLTVASAPLRSDHTSPKGFYLRVVDRRPWLRGYRCDNSYRWNPDDRFVFTSVR